MSSFSNYDKIKGRSPMGIPLDGAQAFNQGWSREQYPKKLTRNEKAEWRKRWDLASELGWEEWMYVHPNLFIK